MFSGPSLNFARQSYSVVTVAEITAPQRLLQSRLAARRRSIDGMSRAASSEPPKSTGCSKPRSLSGMWADPKAGLSPARCDLHPDSPRMDPLKK
jgi:hypothetical protein